MLILALDSTAIVATAAICRDGMPLASFTVKNGNTHSETLLPMIKSLLDTTGLTVDDMDVLACSIGPGSFTGVRIGAATVKGLAFGKSKTVIGVSTLEALARNLLPFDGLVCPVMNARRGQVYNALFRAEGHTLTRLTTDRALSVAELEEELLAMGEAVALCGDGAAMTTAAFTRAELLPVPALAVDQNAVSVAAAAAAAFENGVRTTDADLAPVYLRLPQAERERLQKENQNNDPKG